MSGPSLAELARHWLAIARGDLLTAEAVLQDPLLPARAAAFLAQQAVEKAIKGALVFDGREPPRTHDLTDLLQLLPATWQVRSAGVDLSPLTAAVRPARYPEFLDPPLDHEGARRLVADARRVVDSILADLHDRGVGPASPA